jgi:hypothetical protein
MARIFRRVLISQSFIVISGGPAHGPLSTLIARRSIFELIAYAPLLWRPQMATVARRLKRIELYCPEYNTTAAIRINDAHSSGTDRLEVDYRSPDHSHFTIAIPDDWTDQDLLELIFLPPRDEGPRNWPAWEIPAYQFVSSRLFRFWKGEKKPDK